MAWLFTCECGMQLMLRKRQQRVCCPRCRHVLVVKEAEPQKPVKTKKSSWVLLAAAGILLLILSFSFIFLRSGGPGPEALTGAWVLDKGAVAEAPGGLAIEFREDGTWAGNIPGGSKGGTWKIVDKKGQKLTVEISSPGEYPERVEVTVRDDHRLLLSFPDEPGSFELHRPGPSRAPAATDQQGLPEAGAGTSSQQDANYSLIETGLYQGGSVSEPPPGTRAVINLCEKLDRYQRRVPSYMWVPIADAAPAPSLDWLKEMVRIVDARRRGGQTVYVHCRAGISRSGMVVAAYCMFEHHWTRDQALAFVRSKRPVTHPNPAFMKLLSEWELFLQRQSSAGGRRAAVKSGSELSIAGSLPANS